MGSGAPTGLEPQDQGSVGRERYPKSPRPPTLQPDSGCRVCSHIWKHSDAAVDMSQSGSTNMCKVPASF